MSSFATTELVSATSASRRFWALLEEVSSGKRSKVAILRNNRIDAVILPASEYERLENASESAEDAEIARIIAVRQKTPENTYIPLETVLTENGF